MMENLFQIDLNLLININQGLSNPVLDIFFTLMRNKFFWTPVYLFIISFMLINYKSKGLEMIIYLILVIFFCDQISSTLLKPLVGRLRPCNDPLTKDIINSLVYCGGGYSFPSSHASNHFGLAIFLSGLFFEKFKWVFPTSIVWATIISIAQVYVGKHYPFDVLGGAIIGCIIGFILLRLYHHFNKV